MKCLNVLLLLNMLSFSFMKSTAKEKKNIYLLAVLPYPDPDPSFHPSFDEGDSIRPALDLAKDQINNNPSLLHNYTLNLIHADGGCERVSTTSIAIAELLRPDRRVTGIVGPGCSESATFLGSLVGRQELRLVQVHGGGDPVLSNRTNYRYMLGIYGSAWNHAQAFLYLLEAADWSHVAMLYDSRSYYSTARFMQSQTRVFKFVAPVSSNFIPLGTIQENNRLRVILVLCPLQLTVQILCLAYHNGMMYDNYQWVIMDTVLEEVLQAASFQYNGAIYKCSVQNMEIVMEKVLLTQHRLTPSSNSELITNATYEDYLREYEHYRNVYNSGPLHFSGQRHSTFSYRAAYFYDAVWAWASVLNNLTASNNFDISSEYGNTRQANMIVQQFYATRFKGLSGEINFNPTTGFRMQMVNILQVSANRSILVGTVNQSTFIYMNKLIFKQNKKFLSFFAATVVVLLVIIAFCHIMTLLYHKKPSIKASAPVLLHFSYVGMYLAGTGTFIWLLATVADFTSFLPYVCQLLWAWCLPVGFVLSFMPVATRTWRIYRIFKNPFHPGPLLSDSTLICMTVLTLVAVLMVATAWTVFDPYFLNAYILYSSVVYKCSCKREPYWLATYLLFVTSILIVLSIFGLLTDKVSKKSFTTASLRVLCYIMTLLVLLGLTMYYLLATFTSNSVIRDATLAVIVNLMITAFIVCIFMPPLFPIFKSYATKRTEPQNG